MRWPPRCSAALSSAGPPSAMALLTDLDQGVTNGRDEQQFGQQRRPSAESRIGPCWAVGSVSEKGVQRAADVFLYLVEVGAEDGVDLRGAGEPQPECDLAGSDEVIEMGEVAGRQRPVLGVALDQR